MRLPAKGPGWAQQLAQDILSYMDKHLQQRGCCCTRRRSRTGTHQSSCTPPLRRDPSKKRVRWWFLWLWTHQGHGGPPAGTGSQPLAQRNIERLSCWATRMMQGDQQHSHSWGHLRRRSRGQHWRCTKTPASGDHQRDLRGRWTQSPSPSPTRPWKHVTFQDWESSSREGPLMRQHAQ